MVVVIISLSRGFLINCYYTVHGHVPDSFKRSTIVPIPKGHNVNKSDSANFRRIALPVSSILGKIIDNIRPILDRYHVQLISCDCQFGFKPKSSTNLCSMVLKDTNQNPMICTFLDSIKAFDRINYRKLIKLLVKHELPALNIKVLANLYMNNSVTFSWRGAITDYFTALNEVRPKQGAVLYCVYVNEFFLLILSKAGVGCFIGLHFMGALPYADDFVLLAPTASAMRKHLAIYEDYAREYNIFINALKSRLNV